MRTATFLTILMITSITLCSPVLASAPSDGSTVTVTDSVSWNGGAFDGEIIIKDGAELHWTGDVSVHQDAKITIEEGGTLHLDGANMDSQNAASTLLIYDGTEIEIDENIDDASATMTVFFSIDVPENAYLNLTIDEVTNGEITGDSASFTVDLNQPVNIVVDHYYPIMFGITHIELFHSNAELMIIKADELSQTGGNIIWNQAAFTIENYGSLVAEQSTIMAAEIICNGPCSIEDSDLYGSGPIHVADGSNLEFVESSILGSRTDEDIILHDQANIDYTNSTGTGGYTDAWIRLLSKRELVVNAPVATVVATGIGYSGSTINTIVNGDLDDANSWKVNIGTNEQKRIVEWLDGNGDYGQESGTIKVTVETNWGNFVADTVAPQTSIANIDVVYPQLSIDKVEPEATTADTGRTHGVMVTVSNTGTISVNPNVRCYVGDNEADTTANTANWAVEPGQTKDVPISWYHYDDEAVQLTCKFLYPDVLEPVSNLIASDAGMTSGEVSFTTAEEVEELPIVLYSGIILMVVVFAVIIAVRATKETSKEYVPEETRLPDMEPDNGEESEASEEQEEWLDADGNPIIGSD
ncbi:MAG: Uncharacterised protein [Candidatus Poseidoniaceae archaeon]|nr:MAG: Uncharacterised protein [Candidatus Poseidoniaceae archaeon]